MVRHATPPASQVYAPQSCTVLGQLPAPSQFAASVCEPAAQDAARQLVCEPGKTHAVRFEPLHVEPQVVPAPFPPHAERGLTGVPLVATQVPTLLGALQRSHCPLHCALQHTPSVQKSPDWH